MLTLTVCCLGWGPWHVQTRAIDTGGNTDTSGNLSYTKITLIGWISGSWTQRDGIALAEGLDMFRLGLLTLAGIRTRQAICSLRKEIWLAGCLGVEPREMGSLWLRASMIGGCGPCPFFLVIPWHLPYNWGKARKTSVRVECPILHRRLYKYA
jgi:hypothetical protein